jgi:hypothetical protein
MKRNSALLCILLSVAFQVTISLNSCEKDGSSDDPDDSLFKVSKIIGPSGGILTSTNNESKLAGLKVNIPAGALDKDTLITVKIAETDPPIPEEAVKVSQTFHFGADSLFFYYPVLITLPYDETEATDETRLFVYTYNGSFWDAVSFLGRDTARNLITVMTRHFSDFAVFESLENASTGSIDTYFRPGTDGMQTSNYAYPGNCFGIAGYSKWYFENKKASLGNLKTRNSPDRDIEIASSTQQVLRLENVTGSFYLGLNNDKSAAECLISSLEITRRPQLLGLSANGTDTQHAVLVYKYDRDNKLFYIYDPDFPSSDGITIHFNGVNLDNYGNYKYYTFLTSALYSEDALNAVFYAGTWNAVSINITEGNNTGALITLYNLKIESDFDGSVSFIISKDSDVQYHGFITGSKLVASSCNDFWSWWIDSDEDLQKDPGESGTCNTGTSRIEIDFANDKSGTGTHRSESCSPLGDYNAGDLTSSR